MSQKQELVAFRLRKAKETLQEIDILLANKLWNTAINRTYYACFYAVSALLAASDIEAKTHAGVRQMFGLHFIRPGLIAAEIGDFYATLFHMRQSSDYEDLVEYEEDDATNLLQPARELVAAILGTIN